jgi:hypothetical protein
MNPKATRIHRLRAPSIRLHLLCHLLAGPCLVTQYLCAVILTL